MGKHTRKHKRKVDFDPYDDFDDLYDDDFDSIELSRDIFSTDWGDRYQDEDRINARRKIERRRDMKRLYSQLDEWEEFGERADW